LNNTDKKLSITNEKLGVPDGKSGAWEVNSFEVDEERARDFNARMEYEGTPNRYMVPGKYKRLLVDRQTMMSTTENELEDHREFIIVARKSKSVLINGLGLGVALRLILESDVVEDVTVIDDSADVIKLVAPSYAGDKRVNIIHCDALEYPVPEGKTYGAVWHDIWLKISSTNIELMDKLMDKYKSISSWQDAWMYDMCITLQEEEEETLNIFDAVLGGALNEYKV